jgi:16S rRNA (uracil1498-N3)-methyltransferase
MIRIFLEESSARTALVSVRGEKARYIANVLRCRRGDAVVVTDERNTVTLEMLGPIDLSNESPLDITLVQGMLKGEKMDLVVQKAVELGVRQIIPVVTERSQVRETRKHNRWKKIAEEASRQCMRPLVPFIHEPAELSALCRDTQSLPAQGVIFWERGGDELRSVIGRCREAPIAVFIGPEGGFSEREIGIVSDQGYAVASLGKRILRAETAALAVVSIIQYELGDLGRG